MLQGIAYLEAGVRGGACMLTETHGWQGPSTSPTGWMGPLALYIMVTLSQHPRLSLCQQHHLENGFVTNNRGSRNKLSEGNTGLQELGW